MVKEYSQLSETHVVDKGTHETWVVSSFSPSNITLESDSSLTLVVAVNQLDEVQEIPLHIHLVGDRASLNVVGIIHGRSGSKLPIHFRATHKGKNTKARYHFRSLQEVNSSSGIDAIVTIPEGAEGADVIFTHHALAKGKGSVTRTIPSFEIIPSAVKASHSASIGMIDEGMLFLMQSRGLHRDAACALYAEGFLFQDLNNSSLENSVKEEISSRVL